MQIKTSLKFYLNPVRIDKIKKANYKNKKLKRKKEKGTRNVTVFVGKGTSCSL